MRVLLRNISRAEEGEEKQKEKCFLKLAEQKGGGDLRLDNFYIHKFKEACHMHDTRTVYTSLHVS
jgi:hypothetical protein